jgi:hypothetical protein
MEIASRASFFLEKLEISGKIGNFWKNWKFLEILEISGIFWDFFFAGMTYSSMRHYINMCRNGF